MCLPLWLTLSYFQGNGQTFKEGRSTIIYLPLFWKRGLLSKWITWLPRWAVVFHFRLVHFVEGAWCTGMQNKPQKLSTCCKKKKKKKKKKKNSRNSTRCIHRTKIVYCHVNVFLILDEPRVKVKQVIWGMNFNKRYFPARFWRQLCTF